MNRIIKILITTFAVVCAQKDCGCNDYLDSPVCDPNTYTTYSKCEAACQSVFEIVTGACPLPNSPLPCGCMNFSYPVCDEAKQKTFMNRCQAECVGSLVVSQGKCRSKSTITLPEIQPDVSPPASSSASSPASPPASPLDVPKPIKDVNFRAVDANKENFICPVFSCFTVVTGACPRGTTFAREYSDQGCPLCPGCLNTDGKKVPVCPRVRSCPAVVANFCPYGSVFEKEYDNNGCPGCNGCLKDGKPVDPINQAKAINSPIKVKCLCAKIIQPVCDEKTKKSYNNQCEAFCDRVPTYQLSSGMCEASLATTYQWIGKGFCRDGSKSLGALIKTFVSKASLCAYYCDITKGCIAMAHNNKYVRCIMYGFGMGKLVLWESIPGNGGIQVTRSSGPAVGLYAEDSHCHSKLSAIPPSFVPPSVLSVQPTSPPTNDLSVNPPAIVPVISPPCPAPKNPRFELRSQLFMKKCIQVPPISGSPQKIRLSVCTRDNKNQMFTYENNLLRDYNGRCFNKRLVPVIGNKCSPITLKVTDSNDIGRHIKTDGKCLTTRNGEVLNWVKCNAKVRRQLFIFNSLF